MLPIMQYTTRRQLFRVDGQFKSVRSNRRRLYKTAAPTRERLQKHFSQPATYLAFFSVTYLATSLNIAKLALVTRDLILAFPVTYLAKTRQNLL